MRPAVLFNLMTLVFIWIINKTAVGAWIILHPALANRVETFCHGINVFSGPTASAKQGDTNETAPVNIQASKA